MIEANKLQADESTLTGESLLVGKIIEPLDEETELAERANMLFKGTSITRGSGALALGVGEGIPGIMQKPPRDPREPILTRKHWALIFGYGVLIALPVLAALWIALHWLKMPQGQAVTISFLTLGFSRLGHTFNMRDNDTGVFQNEITRNPFVWGALALCSILLLTTTLVPGLVRVLQVVGPGMQGWLLIFGMSLVPLVFGQVYKMLRKGKRRIHKELNPK